MRLFLVAVALAAVAFADDCTITNGVQRPPPFVLPAALLLSPRHGLGLTPALLSLPPRCPAADYGCYVDTVNPRTLPNQVDNAGS